MRLFGTPRGSSPRNPLSWAPTGLKYRSASTRSSSCRWHASRRICSHIHFVRAYGFVGPAGSSSTIGTRWALP